MHMLFTCGLLSPKGRSVQFTNADNIYVLVVEIVIEPSGLLITCRVVPFCGRLLRLVTTPEVLLWTTVVVTVVFGPPSDPITKLVRF